jgi:DNA-directed RNA polymerase specialized sigma24 family protein
VVENIPHDGIGLSDPELHERVREALASLPPAERAAAVVAFGFDEGPEGVAVELDLSDVDADAITRSALQLLRGALRDVDLDDPQVYARVARRRRSPRSTLPPP